MSGERDGERRPTMGIGESMDRRQAEDGIQTRDAGDGGERDLWVPNRKIEKASKQGR